MKNMRKLIDYYGKNMSEANKNRFNDPIKKQQFSERMKLWWDERRKVGT